MLNENTRLKESQKPAADIIGKNGVLFELAAKLGERHLRHFEGGRAQVTLSMPDKLKGKEVLLVYIDENGFCSTLDHDVERVGADSYIKFTTKHFWQSAVKRTETQQNPKMKQVGNKESTGIDKKLL